MLEASRAHRIPEADRIFVAAASRSLQDAYNEMQVLVHDTWTSTAWCWPGAPGRRSTSPARSMPAPCCASRSTSAADEDNDGGNRNIRTVLPQLMEKYRLMEKTLGKKEADDAWVEG